MKTTGRLIEVIGPAGAGKSFLAENLLRTENIRCAKTAPYFRRIRDFPFFTRNTLSMLPTLLRFYPHKNGRWFTPEETAWMVILNGWSDQLRGSAESAGKPIVVDEGPIFHLAYLHMRGPDVLKKACADPWWQRMYQKVAKTTDLIVWLDAPNAVLLQRIRTRKSAHIYTSITDEKVLWFLDQLRSSYAYLVPRFVEQKSSLNVLKFDTETVCMDEVSEMVLHGIGGSA